MRAEARAESGQNFFKKKLCGRVDTAGETCQDLLMMTGNNNTGSATMTNETSTAMIIAAQMGGIGRLRAMVAASHMADHDNGLSFRFKGSRAANYVKVTLDPDDTYTVEFWKIRGVFSMDKVEELGGVYCDQLIPLFESTTGLYLTL